MPIALNITELRSGLLYFIIKNSVIPRDIRSSSFNNTMGDVDRLNAITAQSSPRRTPSRGTAALSFIARSSKKRKIRKLKNLIRKIKN